MSAPAAVSKPPVPSTQNWAAPTGSSSLASSTATTTPKCWTAPGLIGGRIFELDNLYMGSGLIDTTEEIIGLLATCGLIQAAKGGQTTLIDTFYGRPWLPLLGAEAALRAYRSVGIRVALGITMRDRNTYTHEDDEVFLGRLPPEIADEVRDSPLGYVWPIDDQFRVFDELYKKWDRRNGRSRIILAPDWTPACSDDLYRKCRRAADEYGTTISTHALETRSELMWTLENVGPSGMRRLADLGVLGEDVTLSHFVWATDEDIAIVANTGAVPVHCPGSNLRSSAGICRVRDILDAGAGSASGPMASPRVIERTSSQRSVSPDTSSANPTTLRTTESPRRPCCDPPPNRERSPRASVVSSEPWPRATKLTS